MDKRVKVFWIHPQLRDYRLPFFELMDNGYQITFFYIIDGPIDHHFTVATSRAKCMSGFEPWSMPLRDINILRKNVKKSDVVISSFIRNCHSYYAFVFAKMYRKPFIVWEEWMRMNRSKIRYLLRDYVCGKLLKYVNCIYTLGVCQEHLYLKMGIPTDRIFRANEYPGFIYSLIDPVRVARTDLSECDVVLYIGRLIKVKGVEYLISSFSEVIHQNPNAVLLIVGEGSEESSLRDKVTRLGLNCVQFLGPIYDVNQKAYLYQTARVVVIPSIETDNKCDPGPLVTLEALSAGTPIVISRAVGNSYHVRQGLSGYVVPPKDPTALAGAICRCLRGEIGSRSAILDEFSLIPGFSHQKYQMDMAIAKALGGSDGN